MWRADLGLVSRVNNADGSKYDMTKGQACWTFQGTLLAIGGDAQVNLIGGSRVREWTNARKWYTPLPDKRSLQQCTIRSKNRGQLILMCATRGKVV